jgi:cyclomaltodextrinase / maltogenic alpha-amylase / neopullulanase
MYIKTPDWVKDAVFYQIFPDRFARSQHELCQKPATLEDWPTLPTLYSYKGGDLWGVLEKLDYLVNLGITALYLTPIFQSASNHRYHTHDYYVVDPMLGGMPAFQRLLDAAHERGMKIILDGVFNHASRGFFFFHDVLENGPHSPWLDWFHIQGWPLSPYDTERPANYLCWDNNRALPQFNHDNPQVREYLMAVGEYWIRAGIDGWRLDVPECIETTGFWEEFRQRIKTINPEAYLVGEIWGDASPWLDGSQFDGAMNYLFAASTIAFAAGERVQMEHLREGSYQPYPALDAADYAQQIEELLNLYDWEIQLTQLNLINSHDTARLRTIADNDRASVELATLLLLTFPGAPCIYYGDEVGMQGSIDPDSRRGFLPEPQWDQQILSYHRDLIALRDRYTSLRTGTYKTVYASGHVYAFERRLENEILIVVVNADTHPSQMALPSQVKVATVLFGSGNASMADGHMQINLPARSGLIVKLDT